MIKILFKPVLRFFVMVVFCVPILGIDPLYELYVAKIAATEALIQINEVGEAKAHLDSAPERYRDWEWNYLKRKSDSSARSADVDPEGAFAVAVSPDGKTIATGAGDGLILLWVADTFMKSGELRGHGAQVTTIDFSPDGKTIASGSADKTIRIWNLETNTEIRKITDGLSQKIYQVQFDPRGNRLAAASWDFTREPFKVSGFAKIYDLATGKMVLRIDGTDHPVSTVDFSSDGAKIAIGDWGALVQIADSRNGNVLMKKNLYETAVYRAVDSVAFSNDDRALISVGKDKTVRTLDSATGDVLHETNQYRGHGKNINKVAFNRTGSSYATASSDSLIKLWDGETNAPLQTFRGHTREVSNLVFAPGGKMLFSVSPDGKLKAWDLSGGNSVSFDVCDNGPWSAPRSIDGKYLAAGCSDKGIGLWNLSDGKKLGVLPEQTANYVSFSRRGEVVTVGHDSKIVVWDPKTLKQTGVFQPHDKSLYGVDVSRNGLIAAGGDGNLAVIYDISAKKEIKRLNYEGSHPRYVKFTLDGKRLIIGTTDGTIEVFSTTDWSSLKKMKADEPVYNLAVDQEGTMLIAGAAHGDVTVWDLQTYELRHRLTGHNAAVFGVDFHPNGTRAVTAGYDQNVKIWDTKTGRLLLTIRDFDNNLYCVGFLGDGRKLMVTQTDGIVRILE